MPKHPLLSSFPDAPILFLLAIQPFPSYSPLGRTMFLRVRTAGRFLPGNLPNIHSQGCPSFLYARKRCSSRFNHRLYLLVCERLCLSSLEYPSSSLLGSGSLSHKPLSSSLLDGLLPCDARASASASTALPCWGQIRVASLRIGLASAAVNSRSAGREPVPREGNPRQAETKRYCSSEGFIISCDWDYS